MRSERVQRAIRRYTARRSFNQLPGEQTRGSNLAIFDRSRFDDGSVLLEDGTDGFDISHFDMGGHFAPVPTDLRARFDQNYFDRNRNLGD